MHGSGGGPTATLVALLLVTVPLTMAAAGPAPATTEQATAPTDPAQPPTPQDVLDAYTWSTTHDDTLVSPLVTATAPHGWTPEILAAWHEGQAWANTTLDTADRGTLTTALLTLTAAASPDAPLTEADLASEQVPEAMVAPLATLVELQLHAGAPAQPLAPLPSAATTDSPWQTARADAIDAAFTLGALETLREALHEAKHGVHLDEPLPLSPLGLVILGSTDDDVYAPQTIDPLTLQGPLVLVEPGGDDTYHVPVAARTHVAHPQVPLTNRDSFHTDPSAIAIELAGDDTYTKDTATARQGQTSQHLLLEEAGNDTYGTLDSAKNLAHAEPGFAYLHDKAGDDAYRVQDRGLGYAAMLRTAGRIGATAILADKGGDDAYTAETESTSVFVPEGRTHGNAENAGAIALVRDYSGNDAYTANHISFATADDDGTALLWDDSGAETYHVDLHGGTTFGAKSIEEGGALFAPTERSLGYFLDGAGEDTYTWDETCCDPQPVENDLTRVNTTEEHKWGVFVDCQTPSDAAVPCPEEQATVLERIAHGET